MKQELTGCDTHLDEQLDTLKHLLMRNETFTDIFAKLPAFGVPNVYVGAGFVAQSVWNTLSGFPFLRNIKDVDIVYYDNSDLSQKAEEEVERSVRARFPGIALEVEVKNQARVHLWYEEFFGYPIPPYSSVECGINSWPATATAIGIQNIEGRFKVYAPYGLNDLFGFIVRPNKLQITEEIYQKKAARWKAAWPKLKVLPW